jgi:hypothetical protein
MPYINVDLDDVLSSLNGDELQQLADELYDDGYVPSQVEEVLSGVAGHGVSADLFSEALGRLGTHRLELSKDEEELILKLASKF